MELNVISSPERSALEEEFTSLMKSVPRGVVSIVPDQSSFAEEERLMDIFKVTGLGNPEVLSFKRLFFKLRDKYPSGKRRLSSAAREMAVMYAINSVRDEDFRLFKGVVQKSRLAGAVSGLITGFKRYGVDESALQKAEDNLAPSALKNKIHDSLLTLKSYNRLLESSSLSDADDDLWELGRILSLPECDFFKGKTVFIRHFSDLNKVQRLCVGHICSRADAVYVGVLWDDKPEFATTKTLIDGLRATSRDFSVPFSFKTVTPKFSENDALMYAFANYYSKDALPFPADEACPLHIHVSKNPSDEVRHVAATIARLISRGVRPGDITVAARSSEDYDEYIRRIFPTYEIPFFADGSEPLSKHSVAAFITAALDLALFGFSHERVFAFAKNPFAPQGGSCGDLEDYCLEAGVRSWNWSEDFTFIRGSYNAAEYGKETVPPDLIEINRLRGEIYSLIQPLKEGLEKERTGEEYAKLLYDFIVSARLPEKAERSAKLLLENGDRRGSEETRQVYNLLVEILEDIYTDFATLTLSPEEFVTSFKTACAAVLVGSIPLTKDSVIFGNVERMKGNRSDYVFLLGINEDVFPRTFADTSVFTEYEAEILRQSHGIELPPMSGEKTENEKLLVYEAVSSAKKALYISYPIASSRGENLRPSSLAERLRFLFPALHETEDVNTSCSEYLCATKQAAYFELFAARGRDENTKFWQLIKSLLASDEKYLPRLELIDKSHGYESEKTEPLDAALLQKVLGDELYLSASRLDSYGECPFSFFLQSILRLKEQKEMNISFTDSGNLMHNIIDGFCAVVKERKGTWHSLTDASTEKIFQDVCGEIRLGINPHILNDPRFFAALERIEKFAFKCIQEIRAQLSEELFVPTGNEVIIGENGAISPVKLYLPDGQKINFTGRIDRTDISRGVKITEDGQTKTVDLVRIVDYKSSGRDIDFNKVLNGLSLQLFAYMDAFSAANPDSRAAGVLYFNLSETLVATEIGTRTTEKKDRLSGVSVKGRMAERESVVQIEAEEMQALLKFTRKAIAKTAQKIYAGDVSISPLKTDTSYKCDYCGFRNVCRAEEMPSSCVRYIPKDKSSAALKEIVKEAEKIES